MTITARDAAAPEQFSAQLIRANTELPARRSDIELHTADGLTLVGELAMPLDREPAATLITLHPLPTHGGFMDSHIFRKAALRLPALAGLAILRFNTRGTSSPRGTSQGSFDHAVGERFDVAAAIEFVEFQGLPQPWLLGWSFGTDLVLKHGCDPAVCGAILLSPTRRYSTDAELAVWGNSAKPVIALIPEFDDFLRPDEAPAKFAAIPQAEIIPVAGAKHLWVGEPSVRRVHQEIVDRVNPAAGVLPVELREARP
ncbi:MAG: alpha/beta hydrolase [Angustibacter sp.]